MIAIAKNNILIPDKAVEDGKKYKVTPLKRTEEQNNLLWQLLSDILEAQNTRYTNDDKWNLYTQLLVKSGAKSDIVVVIPEAYESLVKQFRAVTRVGTLKIGNKEFAKYQCFYGSSTFNKKEMSMLIDVVLDYATNVGIDVNHYEKELRK